MASSERHAVAARGTAPGPLPALLAVALAACSAASADPAPVSAAAAAFLSDQRDGAWLAAYGRLHPGMQQRCGSGERLRAVVEEAGERPLHWRLAAPVVQRYTAQLTGAVQRADGGSSAIALSFDRVEGGWAITAWSSGNRELCP